MKDSANPVTFIALRKRRSAKAVLDGLVPLARYLAVVIAVDVENNDLNNPYMLIWRTVNNIDAQRDIVLEPFIAVDATAKNDLDGYIREWPGDTHCDSPVLEKLKEKGVIDIDRDFSIKFGLLPYNLYQ
jgi:4-hydroxy-3-polyprenylbenzoate decarboxylase